jgi:NADP-dependent 3-hydroxy acid dehydrogenase YdfG
LFIIGIGRAVATAFLKEGAHVVLVGRNKTELESVAQQGPGFFFLKLHSFTIYVD